MKHVTREWTLLRLLSMTLLASTLSVSVFGQERYDLTDADEWQRTESAPPGSDEAKIAEARRALAERNFGRASDLAARFIKTNEDSLLVADAYLIRGDARMGKHNYYKALFDYEAVARLYPSSEVFVTALERELDIAKLYARGKKRKFLGLRTIDTSDIAEELFIRVQERMPGSNLAEEAGLELGDFYFRRNDMALAAEAYDLYIENYPKSNDLNKARRRLIAAHLDSYEGPKFDASGLSAARSRLREMKVLEPAAAAEIQADARIAGIDEELARKMLETAKWYKKTNDPIAAEVTVRRLVQRYPRSEATQQALKWIPDLLDDLPDGLRDRVLPIYNQVGLNQPVAVEQPVETENEPAEELIEENQPVQQQPSDTSANPDVREIE